MDAGKFDSRTTYQTIKNIPVAQVIQTRDVIKALVSSRFNWIRAKRKVGLVVSAYIEASFINRN